MSHYRQQLFIALFCTQAIACTQALKTDDSTESYFIDAQQCGRQSQFATEIRINAGAPGGRLGGAGSAVGKIPIDVGLDGEKYQVCMEDRGRAIDLSKDPYFGQIAECSERANARGQITKTSAGGVYLKNTFDAAIYAECLKGKGIAGEVIVHPLQPE